MSGTTDGGGWVNPTDEPVEVRAAFDGLPCETEATLAVVHLKVAHAIDAQFSDDYPSIASWHAERFPGCEWTPTGVFAATQGRARAEAAANQAAPGPSFGDAVGVLRRLPAEGRRGVIFAVAETLEAASTGDVLSPGEASAAASLLYVVGAKA